jgi:uncharacterized DUF497 family protein
MKLTFFVDPETDQPHLFSHGVTEEEVRDILARPGLILKGSDESRLALGQTKAGRYLKVVYSPLKQGPSLFVITAYELRGKELKAYRRRRRRKPK